MPSWHSPLPAQQRQPFWYISCLSSYQGGYGMKYSGFETTELLWLGRCLAFQHKSRWDEMSSTVIMNPKELLLYPLLMSLQRTQTVDTAECPSENDGKLFP